MNSTKSLTRFGIAALAAAAILIGVASINTASAACTQDDGTEIETFGEAAACADANEMSIMDNAMAIDELSMGLNAGAAMSMALDGIPQAGLATFGLGMSSYEDQIGVAVGINGATSIGDAKFAYRLGVASTTEFGNFGVAGGISFGF